MVFSEKGAFISAVGGDFCSGKSEEAFRHPFIIHLFILFERVKIAVDLLYDPVFFEQSAGDEQGVLEIYLILLIVAVICKFRISGKRQTALVV